MARTLHSCNKEAELAVMQADIKHIVRLLEEPTTGLCMETRKNSEFRLQAKTIIGAVGFVSATMGGIIVWIMSKFWSK